MRPEDDDPTGASPDHEVIGRDPPADRAPANPPSPGEAPDDLDPIELDEETSKQVTALKPTQQRALTALMSEPSVAAAARAANIGQRTLHHWLEHDAAFIAAYRRVKRMAFEQAAGLTQRYAAMAVHTLAKVMVDPAAPYPARVTAAASILRFGRDSVELEDVLQRVEDLEARLAKEQG